MKGVHTPIVTTDALAKIKKAIEPMNGKAWDASHRVDACDEIEILTNVGMSVQMPVPNPESWKRDHAPDNGLYVVTCGLDNPKPFDTLDGVVEEILHITARAFVAEHHDKPMCLDDFLHGYGHSLTTEDLKKGRAISEAFNKL